MGNLEPIKCNETTLKPKSPVEEEEGISKPQKLDSETRMRPKHSENTEAGIDRLIEPETPIFRGQSGRPENRRKRRNRKAGKAYIVYVLNT